MPSPRASPSYTARKSLPHSRETLSLGRSRLSHSTVAPEEDDDDDDGSDGGGAPDYGGYDDNFDDEGDVPPPVSRTPHRTPHRVQTPRRTSFAQMDQEAEEEAQVEDEMDFSRSPSAKARGKQRASFVSPPPPQYEDDMEPEIAQGLEDLEQEPDEEEDIEPPSMKAVQRKKGKEVVTKPKERAKPREKPRPRKDIVLRERGCQIWCMSIRKQSLMVSQSLLMTRTPMVYDAASACGILPSPGGGWRKWCTDAERTERVMCPALRRFTESRKSNRNLSERRRGADSAGRAVRLTSQRLSKSSFTTPKAGGTTRLIRTAMSSSTERTERRLRDVSDLKCLYARI